MTKEISRSKCELCVAKCCMYVATMIDTPKTKEDVDDIRWYLAHGIWVFFERNDEGKIEWYIQINNPCKYLDEKFKCTIYDKRPSICRQHSEEECEFDDDLDYHMFRSMEQFEEYLAITPFEELIKD